MQWTENAVRNIIADMAEEDPFACQALFRITEVEFTKDVPTLAVSLASRPTLFVNREFLDGHAQSEEDVKAVLMHEFLHVVLQHTEKFTSNTPLLNIALDAVINAIIHRTHGEAYSDFFRRFYRPEGLQILLRTWETADKVTTDRWQALHQKVYSGAIAADDLLELFQSMCRHRYLVKIQLIGGHDRWGNPVSEENRKLLEGILERMDGTGIWNKPRDPGRADMMQRESRRREKMRMRDWNRDTLRILEKCLLPDRSSHRETASPLRLPILSPGDRKSFAGLRSGGFIPFSEHATVKRRPADSVNVYLDVSGSMSQEIDRLLSMLEGFREHIRKPLWVFSDQVDPAVFRNGRIEYRSTGGTSISCVFDHIRENRFRRSLIVTDGYIEYIRPEMLRGIDLGGLRVLLSSMGQGAAFEGKGITYHQLKFIAT